MHGIHCGDAFSIGSATAVLDPERTVQIGIRGGAEYLWDFSHVSA